MKFPRIKFSLSQKIILSMASMVLLTVLASATLFYFVFTSQVDDFTKRLDQARVVALQENSVQHPVSDAEMVNRIRTALSSGASSQEVLDRVRQTLNVNREINATIIKNALQQAGGPFTNPLEMKPPHGPNFFNIPTSNQLVSRVIFSPIANSIWVGVGLAAVMAIVLGFFLARGIVKPLRTLEKASEQVADGNYKLQIKQTGDSDLSRLASSFNRMAHTLSLTEQKRKDLLTDMSHEFRTPLSSIQGYTEVLRDGLAIDQQHQNEIYDHILKEVKHLTNMVNAMRVWVSNEQALENLNFVETTVTPLAQEVIKRFQPVAYQKNIKLELEVASPEPRVRTDTDSVIHALSNLVDNALRYTPEAGTVQVKIEYHAPNPKSDSLKVSGQPRVWFEVSDSGVGIASEHLPFVFERFYRVDKSRSRNTGGSGLGLAIVRDTVQTLGGEVKISSEPGIGTTIGFWLPALPAARPTRHLLPVFSNA